MPRKTRRPSRNQKSIRKSLKGKKTKGVAGRYKPLSKEGTQKSLRISAARNRKDMDNLFKGFESMGLKPKNNSPKKRQGASKKKSKKAGTNRMEGIRKTSINNKRSLAKKYWRQIRGDDGNPRNNKPRVSRKPSVSTIQELFKDLKLK
jgi:hypothetical protein